MMLKTVVLCSLGVFLMTGVTAGDLLSWEPFKFLDGICKIHEPNFNLKLSQNFKCVLKNLGFIDDNDDLSNAGIEKFYVDKYGQSDAAQQVIKLTQQCTQVTGGCKIEKMKHFIQCLITSNVLNHFEPSEVFNTKTMG